MNGLISVCKWCEKKMKVNGCWVDVDDDFDFSRPDITHGICPSCEDAMWNEYRKNLMR